MKFVAVAEVIAVVDADTVHTFLDIGWGITLRPRGRYGGYGTLRICFPDCTDYDAPERGTEHGKLAKVAAKALVLPGQKLEIVSHGLDSLNNRTVASITLPNGEDWATVMTALGFVKA